MESSLKSEVLDLVNGEITQERIAKILLPVLSNFVNSYDNNPQFKEQMKNLLLSDSNLEVVNKMKDANIDMIIENLIK